MEEIRSHTESDQDLVKSSNISVKNNKKIPLWLILTVSIIVLSSTALIGYSFWSGMQIISICSNYSGNTVEGTVLDSFNSGISVTGRTRNGKSIEIPSGEWSIASPKTLQADSSSIVRITYKDTSCELKVSCTSSNIARIEAYYDGNLEAGTPVTTASDGFHASAFLKDGTKFDISDKCIIVDSPIIIKADVTTQIEVHYCDPITQKTFAYNFSVLSTTRTVKRLSAEYRGSAQEGEVLDSSNNGFVVTATYSNGDSEVVNGWKIAEPATLKSSQSSTVIISYSGQEVSVTVECSLFVPETYKSLCAPVSYDELVRTPDVYEGNPVKISGRIHHIETDNSSDSCCIYHVYTGYYDDPIKIRFSGTLTSGNLMEDDYITCYGEYQGIDATGYSHIPLLNARIIDRK